MAGYLFLLALVFLASAQYDPNRFKPFLMANRMKQCPFNPSQPRLPLSYYVPPTYFDSIPPNQRIPPGDNTQPQMVPSCDHQVIGVDALHAYEFQTERYIATLGLNIYDGSLWAMAVTLLGEAGEATNYLTNLIQTGKTCQFSDVRGDARCKGIIVKGQCTDPEAGGNCGFCYGDPGQSFAMKNAWTFRSIADYWALEGTIDLRCPNLKHEWTWNDYKPILGENAWANLLGPLQVAYRKYGGWQGIPSNDISFQLAIDFLPSLQAMFIPSIGAVGYAPYNTLKDPHTDMGFEVSLENNISLLGGLKALAYILQMKNIYTQYLPQINSLIDSIQNFAKAAYDPQAGYFRQGGVIQMDGSFKWASGSEVFAVDCQTWTMTQLGPRQIDAWFGAGTSDKIWQTTKQLGGYNYKAWNGMCDGLGFAMNAQAQAYSGEWTFGAVNMLRVFAAELGNSSYYDEGTDLRNKIEWNLTEDQTIDGVKCRAIKYCNKRYYIPFGWWGNPVDSLASTAWGVFLDMNWNPLHLGGGYTSQYP